MPGERAGHPSGWPAFGVCACPKWDTECMSIRPVTYYEVICDLCGGDYTGGIESAWHSVARAEDYAADYRGHMEGGNHVCYRCIHGLTMSTRA